MEKSLFEQMGGTYTQIGDYLIPDLTLPEEEQKSIGICIHLVFVTIANQGIQEQFPFSTVGEELLTLDTEVIERSGQSHGLYVFLIASGQVHPFYEIEDTLVRAVLLAFLYDILYGGLTYAFHGA